MHFLKRISNSFAVHVDYRNDGKMCSKKSGFDTSLTFLLPSTHRRSSRKSLLRGSHLFHMSHISQKMSYISVAVLVKFPTKFTVPAKVMSALDRKDYLRRQILN